MRLGILGYNVNTGIGEMCKTLIEQFSINAFLVSHHTDKTKEVYQPNIPNIRYCQDWTPNDADLDWLFDNCDIIFTIETDFNSGLFQKAKARGKKTVLFVMWEYFYDRYKDATVLLCTSKKGYEIVDQPNKVYLPWPIDTSKFPFKERGQSNRIFLHNAGFGGLKNRKGTIEVIKAFFNTISECPKAKLIINSQKPLSDYKDDVAPKTNLFNIINIDRRIVWNTKNWPNNIDIYNEGDVYLYPARYDGQALVAEEAMACGFPTFVTDAKPMNEFSENPMFKIRVATNTPFRVENHDVNLNICDIDDLAKKIIWAYGSDLRDVSHKNREIIEKDFSWNRWKQEYLALFDKIT